MVPGRADTVEQDVQLFRLYKDGQPEDISEAHDLSAQHPELCEGIARGAQRPDCCHGRPVSVSQCCAPGLAPERFAAACGA